VLFQPPTLHELPVGVHAPALRLPFAIEQLLIT
jgi:hypothetical protein